MNIEEYVTNPNNEILEVVREAFNSHDKTCESLPDVWLGRKGGVSDFWSQAPCIKCNMWVYMEGMHKIWFLDPDDNEYYPEDACECCSRDEPKVEYTKDGKLITLPIESENIVIDSPIPADLQVTLDKINEVAKEFSEFSRSIPVGVDPYDKLSEQLKPFSDYATAMSDLMAKMVAEAEESLGLRTKD